MYGTCACDGHIEDVLELRLQLAGPSADRPAVGALSVGGSDNVPADMAVWALLTSGALATIPLAEDQREWTNGVSIVRRGPFHWKMITGLKLTPFLPGGDMRALEQALEVQPGIESAMWSTATTPSSSGRRRCAPTACSARSSWRCAPWPYGDPPTWPRRRCSPGPQPKKTSASAYSSGLTVLSSPVPSISGTRTISVPRTATMTP